MNFILKDSRGRESRTYTLVVASWLAITARFLASGFVAAIPPISPAEYGLATAGVLAIWLNREWQEKKKAAALEPAPVPPP